jgi:tRNA G18 (ribose-2'-O)-methylase SpoU
VIPVTDPDDPRIASFRAVRERDLATLHGCGHAGVFIIEGEVVLRTAARLGRFPIEALLLAEKRVAALGDVVALLKPGTPVYVADQAVMDAVAGFPIHRGILALGRRGPAQAACDVLAALPERALVAAMFGIGNHDNMGGVFRNAAAFGADAVLLGADCCDPLYRKAIRVSVGAALTVPFGWFAAEDDPLALLAQHGFKALALSPSGATPLSEIDRLPRTALLLGAEGTGLDPALLARTKTVSIPMSGGFDSLNLATTSGIALYQLTRR